MPKIFFSFLIECKIYLFFHGHNMGAGTVNFFSLSIELHVKNSEKFTYAVVALLKKNKNELKGIFFVFSLF